MLKRIINLAICPHAKEEEIDKWEIIAKKISGVLKRQIKIKQLKDFSQKISSSKYDIYYLNPDDTLKVLEKGYILLGKLKNENESICSITSKSYSQEKDIIKVALINQRYFFLPLLLYRKEYKKFHLLFANQYEEVINLVTSGKADIGFIHSSFIKKVKIDDRINLSDDFCFSISHFILIHPSLEKYKDALLSVDDFQKVSNYEIDNIKSIYGQLEILLRDWAYHDISEALMSSPNIGVIIYHEKILFFNEYARKLLDYDDKELYNLSSIELVYTEDRHKVVENRKKRLKGEKFSQIYHIRFQKKDGSVIFVECLTNTILFRGLYCGFIIFHDITSEKFTERFKELLILINKIITQSITEEEIYEKICRALVEKLNFKTVSIGLIDEQKSNIIYHYHYGESLNDYEIATSKVSESDNKKIKNILKGEISITPYLRFVPQNSIFSKRIDKKTYISSCMIPLFKSDKVVSVLKLYSDSPNFFNDSIMDILKEIQADISFALERVDRMRHNTIISEALKNSDTWILVTDEKGRIIYVNEAVEKISGYSKEEIIGKNPNIFKSGLNPPEFYKELWDTILAGKIFNSITPNRKKNGEIFHIDLKIIPVKLPGNILRFVAVAKDVTENIRLSERIQKLQNYDALTGLLNMNGFALNVSQKINETYGLGLLILIDIYDMTYINKIYGIQVGDGVLRMFADKIKQIFENNDSIARISADCFGVYTQSDSSEHIYRTYSKLYELRESIFNIDNKQIYLNINASIAIFPKDGIDFKALYERADITLQQTKKIGAGVIQFFNYDIEKEVEKLWEVFHLIKRANEENLYTFYYQPYFHTNDLKIAGIEALVRIIDKNNKIYTPNFFIDYLENSQYLTSFENWAIKEVTNRIKDWNFNISLNISGKTFSNPLFLTILSAISPEIRDRLTIEITERVFINNPDYTMQMLRDIKSMENPPKIAMDDFGTGYSSMLYMRDLPIDIVKIDRAFIKDMINDKKSLAIVQTIIELVKKLGKITLAEGVETDEQYNVLKSEGCDLVQGFLFSKPLAADDIRKILS